MNIYCHPLHSTFTNDNTNTSMKSTKQTLIATSFNHSEILALYETSSECIWLRSMINHIQSSCRISLSSNIPIVIYEDNVACIAQIRRATLKGTEQNIFHWNSFTLISSNKTRRLILERYAPWII